MKDKERIRWLLQHFFKMEARAEKAEAELESFRSMFDLAQARQRVRLAATKRVQPYRYKTK